MKPSITIVVPAFNEAGNIAATTETILKAFEAVGGFSEYDVLVIDDCSKDATSRIVDRLALADPRIRTLHNEQNGGVGYSHLVGTRNSRGDYTGYIPGDNEVTFEAICNMLRAVGEADIINTYIANMEVRPWIRRAISRNFTRAMNMIFGLRLRYFTGPAIIRTSVLKKVHRTTFGFAFMMEIIVQLVKAGYSYKEVPMPMRQRMHGKAKVFRPKDIWRVLKAIIAVLRTVYASPVVEELKAARQDIH